VKQLRLSSNLTMSKLSCRLLKKLKKKNEQQIELEKKEQGFSIYVNGANVGLGQAYSRAKSRSSSRHTKTAGGEILSYA